MADEGVHTLTLLGREMSFRRASQGQILLIQRIAQRSRRDADKDETALGAAYTALMVRILDVIDTLFVDPQDRDDVEQAVLQRELDVEDLMPILSGKRPDAPADDEDPPAIKRKTPKAAAKKTAARRGRA